MSTKYSPEVTNARADPVVLNEAAKTGARKRTYTGVISLATADIDITDIVVLARVPTNVRVQDIRIKNSALAASGITFKAGVYTTAGVVKDDDAYGATQTGLAAVQSIWTTADKRLAANANKYLWEDAGDTSDPGGLYDIAITIDTAAVTPAAGTLAYYIDVTQDS